MRVARFFSEAGSERRDHADAQRVPKRFPRLVSKPDAGGIDGDAANRRMTKTTRREEVRKVRLFFVFFSSRRAPRAARRAPRRSATSWMKTHTNSDSLRFPVIEKTVKPPTHLARGPTRRETRFVFVFPLGFCPPETRSARKKKNANRNDVLFAGDEATEGRFSETPFAVPELQSYPARFVWMPS